MVAPGRRLVAVLICTAAAFAVPAHAIGQTIDPGFDPGTNGRIPGWALDDVDVTAVRILRDPVAGEGTGQIFIGNAVFVDGARPDVSAAFPNAPRNSRAGWGYMLLTNFLPNQGNGSYTLSAYADDAEGHSTLLGTRTITCSNSAATRPFGAIDTPAQGAVVSGSAYVNFGWVLARGPALAYPPFGTVSVIVDGVAVGSPVAWSPRSDLTSLFSASAYPGVSNAVGAFALDTTALADGVHTIAWTVTADNGQTDGVGSRFFVVSNGGSSQASLRAAPASSLDHATVDAAPMFVRRGYAEDASFRAYTAGAGDRTTIQAEQSDRLQLRVGGPGTNGFLRTRSGLAALPAGSTLDAAGLFSWQIGPAFLGRYDLVFVRCAGTPSCVKREVRVVVNPMGSGWSGPQIVIDAPAAQSIVGEPFLLGGWAIDRDAPSGPGSTRCTCGPIPPAAARPCSWASPTAARGPTSPRCSGIASGTAASASSWTRFRRARTIWRCSRGAANNTALLRRKRSA